MSKDIVLVVDLDGTLIRSDMLFESFWGSFAENWLTPFIAIYALFSSRANLKRILANNWNIDISCLPFNQEVIAYIESWQSSGGQVVLVTASDQKIADKVADHLGLFDDVFGSDGKYNLKGTSKARFLLERYGKKGYAYIGDSSVDLPVWGASVKAITVGASKNLKNMVDMLGVEVEHISSYSWSINPYMSSLRPHQWLKNVLIFLPMMAAHQFTSITLWQSIMAFVAFSLLSSSVYVLNDLLELSSDRKHPRKRNRVFASGDLSVKHGFWIIPSLLLISLSIASLLGWPFVMVLFGYYLITFAYSIYFKRIVIVDICVLAGLYTVRIIAGSVATGISPSVWLLAFSIFIFFSLAALKRQAELKGMVERGKKVALGRGYHVNDLSLIAQMATASGYVAVLVLVLYMDSSVMQNLYSFPEILWGVCLITFYWISRMIMVAHRGNMHDDPIVYAINDRISQICLLLVIIILFGATVF